MWELVHGDEKFPGGLELTPDNLEGNTAIEVGAGYDFDYHSENLKINKVLQFGQQRSIQEMPSPEEIR